MNVNNFMFEQLVLKVENNDEDEELGHQELPIDIEEIKMEPKETSPIPEEDIFVMPEFVKVECEPDFEVRDPTPIPKLTSCINCQPPQGQESAGKSEMSSDFVTQLFNCENCKRKFLAESALKYQMKMQKEERKPYSCDVCSLGFALKKPMKAHRRTEHPEVSDPEKKTPGSFNCRVCKVKLTSSYSLKRHMLSHTGERPFTCGVCAKKFSESSKLELHMRIHRGEKSFGCKICSKKFKTKTHLNTHVLIHSEVKAYACEICATKCRDKIRLNAHMKIHSEEKAFACDFCPSKFHLKNYLTQHMRIHAGETPYSCDICQEHFRFKPQLCQHMRIHAGNNFFTCDFCSKCFDFKSSLQKHIAVHLDVQSRKIKKEKDK